MTSRHRIGIAGLVVIGAVLGRGLRDDQAADVALLWLILAALLFGMLGELTSHARSIRAGSAPRSHADPRPADLRSTPSPMPGMRGSWNRVDPRYIRFEAFDSEEGAGRVGVDPGSGHLLGRVVVFSMFQGRDGRGWSDVEIARTLASLRRAADWIEREAVRWDVPVHVDLSSVYFEVVEDDAGGPVEIVLDADGPFEADGTRKALIAFSRAASRLGFQDAADLIGTVGNRVEAEARVWLLHPREAGGSFAIPEADTPWPGVTFAVCYAREKNLPEALNAPPTPDPTTFAHELLHLFRASDKYRAALRSFPPGSVTARDIMRLDQRALSRLQVDPLTAFEIGWTRDTHEKRPSRPPERGRGGHS